MALTQSTCLYVYIKHVRRRVHVVVSVRGKLHVTLGRDLQSRLFDLTSPPHCILLISIVAFCSKCAMCQWWIIMNKTDPSYFHCTQGGLLQSVRRVSRVPRWALQAPPEACIGFPREFQNMLLFGCPKDPLHGITLNDSLLRHYSAESVAVPASALFVHALHCNPYGHWWR